MKRTGQLPSSLELAREYRFPVADRTRSDWAKRSWISRDIPGVVGLHSYEQRGLARMVTQN
jgi:hypothetical protein